MAVTIASGKRGWYDGGASLFWTANVLHDTGSALYAVLQDDSGGTPKIRVYKGNAYPYPTSFSECDSANARTINSVDNSYDAAPALADSVLHICYFSGANTITHYQFSTATDAWGASRGAATTDGDPTAPIRVAWQRSNDLVRILYASAADDCDIAEVRGTSGGSWTIIARSLQTSTEASIPMDFMQNDAAATSRTFWNAHVASVNDSLVNSLRSTNTAGTSTAVTSTAATTTAAMPAGGRFSKWVDGGTERFTLAALSSTGTIVEGSITATADTSGSVAGASTVESTAADVGSRTPLSTAPAGSAGASIYLAWWDDASSGTIYYKIKTGGATSGTWGSRQTFATGITKLIEIVPITTDGLAVVYQSGTDVVMDWIVSPVVNVTATISTGLMSSAGQSITGLAGVLGVIATGLYFVAGQSIGADARTIGTITTQNLSVSGQSIAARSGVLATLATGQPSLQGQSIAARSGVLASLSTQNLVVSGQTILVDVHLLASITTQNLSVSGQTIIGTAAGSIVGAITTGNHVVSGQSIGATFGVLATLATGTPSLQGQSIAGKWGDLGAISTQNLVVSGQSIAARTGVLGSITTGTPALQGQSIAASSGVLAVLVTGTPSLQGQSISGRWGTLGTLSTQNLVVSGQTILASASLAGIISTQNLSVSGQSIAARWGTLATLSTGTPSLQGQTILGNLGVLATVNNGPLSVSGQSINAGTSFIGSINTGNLSVSGQSIVAIYGVVAVLDTGILVVSGNPIIVDIGAFYEVDEAYIVNVFVRPTVLHTINKYNSTVVGARQREIKVGHE